jgi:dTDP-4-dehydrorhamnose 3,5-epimerase
MRFSAHPLAIPEVLCIELPRFSDGRGFVFEWYRQNEFSDLGMPRFVQDNHSRSTRGVLRGLHYQLAPRAQGKLLRCIRGSIYDVAVDIRRGSPTYGRWVGKELSEEDPRMLYVPAGFAHGFCVTSDVAEILYRTTDYYSPEHERGIRWDDPALAIDWPLAQPVISAKDSAAPGLAQAENNFEI